MKKLIAVAVTLVLMLTLACSAFAEPAEVLKTGWEEILSGIDGVIDVEEIPLSETDPLYSEKYLVVFEQLLDWKNPEAGSFPQRVLISLREDAPVNVIGTEGYALIDMIMGNGSDSAEYLKMPEAVAEMAQILGGNYFQVEHRFFGKSRPEDMSDEDVRYWEYHTAENAANDYHRIYTSLAPLFDGKWISTGSSRGGDMTNAYGYFFPDDMALYAPYVAPGSLKQEDARLYPFVFTEIGNSAFGAEEAGKMRDLLLSFQVMMLKNKPMLLDGYEAIALQQFGCVFRPQADIGVIYDMNVMEFAAQFWQYQNVPFETVQQIMDMPETTEEELQNKLIAGISLMLQVQSPMDYAANSFMWPYYVNAATTYGQYHYDFSFLRQALKEAGAEDTLSVTEDMEDGLIWNVILTEEQKAAFTYDGSYRESMLEALKTTDAKYLMLFGATDPWTSVGITECSNPNVKIFIHPTAPHSAMISTLPPDMIAEIISVLQAWLAE